MNDNNHTSDANGIDLGEPIAELAHLSEEPSGGFMGRIRGSIQRRIFAADTLDFSLMALFATFLDYLNLGIQSFFMLGSQERERK